MTTWSRWLGAVVVLGLAACSASDGEDVGGDRTALTAVASFGSNPGDLSMYEYVPPGVPANAPLVVALHGCTQSAADYVGAGWNDLAAKWKFYVVYAEQKSGNNQNKCFNFFDPNDASRGAGEALSIKQMVDDMKARHSIDPARVYVTGLSAGGAMTAVMLATYPDVFAGGAIMAGLPFRCAQTMGDAFSCMAGSVTKSPSQWGGLVRGASSWGGTFPRVSIWQGTSDTTVRPANADELAKQWTDANGIDAVADATSTVDGATHVEYKDGSATLVETWTIPKMTHGTAVRPGWAPANGCGKAGAYVLDAGICSTYYAGLFFGLGAPSVADAGAPDSASAPDAAPPVVDAGKDASDAGPTQCKTYTDSIYNHVKLGHAYRCGIGGSYACATGSNKQIGLWNMMPATLRETVPGWYELGACP